MTCFILGDSIAVGLAAFMPFCAVDGRIGAGAPEITRKVRPADWTVVSAGSNDSPQGLQETLWHLRGKIGGKVVWVEPAEHHRAEIVKLTALRNGDVTVRFTASPDQVHPRSYQELAKITCFR